MTHRTTLLPTVLIALLAIAAVPAMPGQASPADHPVPVHVSEFRFTGASLPAADSWSAFAVRVDRDAWLSLEAEMPMSLDPMRPSRAYVLFAVDGRTDVPAVGWTGTSGMPMAASVQTRFGSVQCCDPIGPYEPGGAGSVGMSDIYLHAGETLYVGFMGANLDVTTGEAVLRAYEADLEVVDALGGTTVELVDLRELARRQGTHAEVFDRTLLTRPGSVTVEWSGRGFLGVDAYAFGDARATLSVTTPSAQHFQDEVLAEEWAQVVAYERGVFRVELDELREPVELVRGDRGEVRVEAFYAELALPGEGAYAWIWG